MVIGHGDSRTWMPSRHRHLSMSPRWSKGKINEYWIRKRCSLYIRYKYLNDFKGNLADTDAVKEHLEEMYKRNKPVEHLFVVRQTTSQ